MAKKYHTLFVRDADTWSPEFGSYDKQDVKDEFDDYRDHDVKAKDLLIVSHDDNIHWQTVLQCALRKKGEL